MYAVETNSSGRSLERSGRRGRAEGFTILEIMIATAILTLGLVGILALFPVAIHSGKQVVEKSTAVVVAESVAEAIREGIRNNMRYNVSTEDMYFVFKHDGYVDANNNGELDDGEKDPVPVTRKSENPRRSYYILMPYPKARRYSGRAGRDRFMEVAKTFLYPETDRNANGNGRATRADDDADDMTVNLSTGDSYKDIWVEQTYRLGASLPGMEDSGADVLDDQKIDLIKQFSYAFTISPSRSDANRSPNPDQFIPAGRLYHVRVMVFRSFYPAARDAPQPTPVYELDFEVSI